MCKSLEKMKFISCSYTLFGVSRHHQSLHTSSGGPKLFLCIWKINELYESVASRVDVRDTETWTCFGISKVISEKLHRVHFVIKKRYATLYDRDTIFGFTFLFVFCVFENILLRFSDSWWVVVHSSVFTQPNKRGQWTLSMREDMSRRSERERIQINPRDLFDLHDFWYFCVWWVTGYDDWAVILRRISINARFRIAESKKSVVSCPSR